MPNNWDGRFGHYPRLKGPSGRSGRRKRAREREPGPTWRRGSPLLTGTGAVPHLALARYDADTPFSHPVPGGPMFFIAVARARRFCVPVVTALGFFHAIASAAEPPRYVITDLGTLGGP